MKNKIKFLRDERGLSQTKLADLVGTGRSQIVKLERGERRLTDVWMRRLSDALKCHPLDLMDGGPAQLKPKEQALVDLYRGLSEEQQDAFYRAASAVAQPEKQDDDDDDDQQETGT